MSFLQVSGISKEREGRAILDQVSFSQQASQKLAIAGETGSGKTTLLQIIAGLGQADRGEVYLNNEKIVGADEKLLPGHPSIAYLSQHFELRNHYRVEEILAYANQLPDADALAIFKLCQVEDLLKRKTDQISGGERQRIALARLLISSPSLLLLDEPFSNLDMSHKKTMKEVIEQVGRRLDITLILVSHDPNDILSWADEILVLQAGRFVQKGPPQTIYRQPANEYVAALFGDYNLLDATLFNLLPASCLAPGIEVLARPESIQVVKEANAERTAEVHNITYFGRHYEIQALIKNQLLRITTPHTSLRIGDFMTLWMDPADGFVFRQHVGDAG